MNMPNELMLKVKREGDHDLPLPTRATQDAVGFDLRSAIAIDLYPGQRALIPTGFAWEIPAHLAGMIWPRSGLAVNNGIDRLAGLVDPDYRGELKAVLLNTGETVLKIKPGDRVAQLALVPFARGFVVEAAELDDSVRDSGGFGSTGVA